MAAGQTPYRGLDAISDSLYGWIRRRRISPSRWLALAERIHTESESHQALDHAAFQQRLDDSRALCRRRQTLSESELVRVFAVITEACWRSSGKRPYPVQLCAALLMYQGHAVQMATGEGKTLTASLGAVVRAWHGRAVHVITSNDYLARRDAELLQPLYRYCGLTVGFIQDAMPPEERRDHYRCDITYATSGSVLADYLKDRLQQESAPNSHAERIDCLLEPALPQRRLVPALDDVIVDEADSVLADDAITPLIISMRQPDEPLRAATLAAVQYVAELKPDQDYKLYPQARSVVITDAGLDRLDEWQAHFPPAWRVRHKLAHVMTQTLTAHYLFEKDRDYAVIDDEVVLVDAKTGRLMHSRSLSHGLQQAIEAKENVPLTDPASISARMSFQAFFRLYRSICGMSGTLQYIESELWRVYRLSCVHVPSRLPRQHHSLGEVMLVDEGHKYDAIVEHLNTLDLNARAVLVGTGSILESQQLSSLLQQCGLPHQVLNALNDHEEADIIARAGQPGKITVATNMAGRGTDIMLGEGVERAGGLHVVATERGPSRRVDLQLFGRASRQGQVGSSISFLCLEDDLMMKKLPPSVHARLVTAFNWPGMRWLSLQLYRYLQSRADSNGSRQRIRILLEDIRFQQVMSFTRKIG